MQLKGAVLCYTDGFITNPKTSTILSILFDQLYTYYIDTDYFGIDTEYALAILKERDYKLFKINKRTGKIFEEDMWSEFHNETSAIHIDNSLVLFLTENEYLPG